MVVEKQHKIYKAGYTLELIGGDILYLIFDGTVKVDLAKAKIIRDVVLDMCKGNLFKTIVDFRGVSGVTNQEARQFMSKNENFKNLKLCDAFITDSFSTSVIIGMYIKLFTPKTPTKTFSNFDEALKWVESI